MLRHPILPTSSRARGGGGHSHWGGHTNASRMDEPPAYRTVCQSVLCNVGDLTPHGETTDLFKSHDWCHLSEMSCYHRGSWMCHLCLHTARQMRSPTLQLQGYGILSKDPSVHATCEIVVLICVHRLLSSDCKLPFTLHAVLPVAKLGTVPFMFNAHMHSCIGEVCLACIVS